MCVDGVKRSRSGGYFRGGAVLLWLYVCVKRWVSVCVCCIWHWHSMSGFGLPTARHMRDNKNNPFEHMVMWCCVKSVNCVSLWKHVRSAVTWTVYMHLHTVSGSVVLSHTHSFPFLSPLPLLYIDIHTHMNAQTHIYHSQENTAMLSLSHPDAAFLSFFLACDSPFPFILSPPYISILMPSLAVSDLMRLLMRHLIWYWMEMAW